MQSAIDSVLQQFVPYWTPKSKSTFTPLTIKNFKCKINVQIKPSDIMEDILGYLYDENLDPKDMPIVRYILYQLIFPKLAEEREQALAVGVYKENSVSQDGGTASAALDCMDGYVTQLKALKTAENEKVTWLLDGTALSTDGETLLSQENINPDVLTERGYVTYYPADADLTENEIGTRPLRILAAAVFGELHTDLVIRDDDAKKLLGRSANIELLKTGKIHILCNRENLNLTLSAPLEK